jgi:hypothetical protein
MLDLYEVHPWQMERWTGSELRDLVKYDRAKQEQARREAEREVI